MASPFFSDIYKIFYYATKKGPLEALKNKSSGHGVGIASPDSLYDIRQAQWGNSNAPVLVQVASGSEQVDASSFTNRLNRYKEYERMEIIPEIHTSLNIFSDESCLVGETLISTPFGLIPIADLAQHKKPEERFLVYCWDFQKEDYSLGWAYHPRKVKKSKVVKLYFENGKFNKMTADHRVLLYSGEWKCAGDLRTGDEIRPFHRESSNGFANKYKDKRYARIYTANDGWITERQFVDEWKLGRRLEEYEEIGSILRAIENTRTLAEAAETINMTLDHLRHILKKAGFTHDELKSLNRKCPKIRRIINVVPMDEEVDVYDMSVDVHENFATDCCIVHNCQMDSKGKILQVKCSNKSVKEEAEFALERLWEADEKAWSIQRNLCKLGDQFLEGIIDPYNPRNGFVNVVPLPAESMYRIESVKGTLIEFQQSKEGPDYESLKRVDISKATEAELSQSTAIRFHENQIVHLRIGDNRKNFYPYGISVLEPAKGVAWLLKLMEDAMLSYRLTRGTERRVFYIDIGNLSPARAETFIERFKDNLKKKKVFSRRGSTGASAVEEKWNSTPIDEDIFFPIRPGTQTRVETLPGACLDLNTEIALLDGRNLKLSEIIDEFNLGKKNWAYGCNPKTGEVVPAPITWAGITRKNTQVMKITLDNGKSVICTPDHKFPLLNGIKTKAEDLKIGDSLIPFNKKLEKIKPNHRNSYEQVYDISKKDWVFTHRMVAEYFCDTPLENSMLFNEDNINLEKTLIHHKDVNRFNNNPENLYWMSWKDHKELHSKDIQKWAKQGYSALRAKENKLKEEDPKAYQELMNRKQLGFNNFRANITAEDRLDLNAKISTSLKEFHDNLSDEDKKARDKKLSDLSKKAVNALQKIIKEDEAYLPQWRELHQEGWVRFAKDKERFNARSAKISVNSKELMKDEEYKKNIFIKQTVVYPQSMFDQFCEAIKEGLLLEEAIKNIEENQQIMEEYVQANKHMKRASFDPNNIGKQHIRKMISNYGYSGIRELRRKLTGGLTNRSSSANGKKAYGRFTLNFPQSIAGRLMKGLSQGLKTKDILNDINSDEKLMNDFKEANKHLIKKKSGLRANLNEGIKRIHVDIIFKINGYANMKHARQEAQLYNHKIVSIEYLTEPMDTGTLTIDGNEEFNNFHTFALSSCGVMTYNSNLDQISDVSYFQKKVLTALQFPKNYLTNEDPSATRLTLSQQDVRFARLIERLQRPQARGWELMVKRHLSLMGYPPEDFRDLEVRMTAPSDWRQINRNEVTEALYNRAVALKGAQIFSDYDCLTRVLEFDEQDAKDIVARTKAQKMEDLKMQLIGQNPTEFGLTPMSDQGTQIGTTPEGPNPQLSPVQNQEDQLPQIGQEGQPPEGAPPQGDEQQQQPEKPKSKTKLPDPTEDQIAKYDLGIEGSRFIDDEEIDRNQVSDDMGI